ncbi:hypothetical protein J5N97_010067 [Dioscorea zingiberensis]|uniref:Uncharacterized protein n=1 Tax=Dioscorea zingiberensis TaxID=325984 RepID=A0A9D5HNA1_9LILI|nr:hypothetical protein J5N97_010067 [Dioscorea zingiberensis]
MKHLQITPIIFFVLCTSIIIRAQQAYYGSDVDCSIKGTTTPPSPYYLYTCNGYHLSCQTFLLFNAQPNFTSVSSISNLMSLNPSKLAQINKVGEYHKFPSGMEVIIPVNCSCSGQYYQANTSYVTGDDDTYYSVATHVYQGLSSCSSLASENSHDPNELYGGLELLVPLRCACPTENQTKDGINYLLTYPIYENDSVYDLSQRFKVSEQTTASANGLTEADPVVFQGTTILIPLRTPPSSNQTIIHYPIQYPPPGSTPGPGPPLVVAHNSKGRHPLWIGIGVAFLFIICAAVPIALYLLRKRAVGNEKKKRKRCVLPKDVLEYQAGAGHALKVFEFEELEAATDNFSSERRLGVSVYKGVLRGNIMAIKETFKDSSKEVNILHKLNHFNLISLLGVSSGLENCYLVYEYMENGSLKDWLYNNSGRLGNWCLKQRIQIALDVAEGLDYLHNFAEPPYVHSDIKSSNILLNGNLRAKIANFSLARASEWKEGGCAITKNVEGTVGYIAPEYLESGMVTPKLDVFAFGVVMLEVITGKDAVIQLEGKEKLLSTVIMCMLEGVDDGDKLSDFIGPAMRDDSQIDLVIPIVKLSVACLNQDPGSRPSMEEVVSILSIIQSDLQSRVML